MKIATLLLLFFPKTVERIESEAYEEGWDNAIAVCWQKAARWQDACKDLVVPGNNEDQIHQAIATVCMEVASQVQQLFKNRRI